MHPSHPALGHDQLIDDFPMNLASPGPSPDSFLPGGVWLEDGNETPLRASNDEVARRSIRESTDTQPPPFASVDSPSRTGTTTRNASSAFPSGHADDANGSDGQDDGRSQLPPIPECYNVAISSLRILPALEFLPNEVLLNVLEFLDVSDLLATSRTSHLLRSLSLAPILHNHRLQRTRQILPPLLSSPTRPTLADLIARSIFLTHTSVVSRQLARSLVSIRLSRRLASRPSAEALVERCVLPKECVPGMASLHIAPALVAKRKAIEKERVKDGLRRWMAAKWKGEVREREEESRRWHETMGVGRVWKLTKFWERVSRGDELPIR